MSRFDWPPPTEEDDRRFRRGLKVAIILTAVLWGGLMAHYLLFVR